MASYRVNVVHLLSLQQFIFNGLKGYVIFKPFKCHLEYNFLPTNPSCKWLPLRLSGCKHIIDIQLFGADVSPRKGIYTNLEHMNTTVIVVLLSGNGLK